MGYNPPTMKKLVSILTLISLYFLVSPVLADEEIRRLNLDLKAKGFTQSLFVDELKSTDINFGPNDKFQLQLTITNAGNRNQTNVKVHQFLPTYISTDSDSEFTIPQIVAGEAYIKNITVTVKDKRYVHSQLTRGQINFNAVTEVGTESQDSLAFYTGNGSFETQVATDSSRSLPATGTSTLIIGTLLASATAAVSLLLRRLARGY